jgi:hypothetical protein
MGLSDNPICKKFGTEEENSVHVLCACEAVALLRHSYLGSFLLDPEDIRKLNIQAIWKFTKGTRLLSFSNRRPRCIEPGRVRTQVAFIHSP